MLETKCVGDNVKMLVTVFRHQFEIGNIATSPTELITIFDQVIFEQEFFEKFRSYNFSPK